MHPIILQSRVSATTRPCWLRRGARNRHRHAIISAVDGVEVDATIQNELAVKFDFHTATNGGTPATKLNATDSHLHDRHRDAAEHLVLETLGIVFVMS